MFEAHAMHAHILLELHAMVAGCGLPDMRTPKLTQMHLKLDVSQAVEESRAEMCHNRPDRSEGL